TSGSASGVLSPGYLQAGTYQVVVDPSLTGDTGSVTLQLTSATDITGSITPNGPPVTATIVTPGQRALYSLARTARRRVRVRVTASTFSDSSDQVELIAPNGTSLGTAPLSSTDAFVPAVTLPVTGSYQVIIDPSQTGDTGSATLQLYAFADQTSSITPGL